MKKSSRAEVYLVDGSAYIYRAYHAITPLSNSKGTPTHAVYGFVNIIQRILREKNPRYMLVAFDSRGPVFRHEMYDQYKANRPPMPEDLSVQIPYIKEVVGALQIPSLAIEGVEADDIIATAAIRLKEQGRKVTIVSGDKDLLQLVDEQVTMWEPMKNKVMDRSAIVEKYHVDPEKLLDCFALMGDSSDNIPGVTGIGPKSAEKLINQHGSLDGVYEHLDEMKKSKMKQNLEAQKESAYLSRQLIALKDDVEIPIDIDFYRLGQADVDRLQPIYEELEFTSLLKNLKSVSPVPTDGFILVQDHEGLSRLEQELIEASMIVLDTETSSTDGRTAELIGISICTNPDSCYYIPVAHVDEQGRPVDGQLLLDDVVSTLRPFLESEDTVKLAHNIKYDYTVLKQNCGIRLAGQLLDTMIAAYLVQPTKRTLKLDDLCLEHLGLQLTPFSALVENPKEEGCFAHVDLETASHYSCEDVYGTLKLYQYYEPMIEEMGMESLLKQTEMALVPILADMEIRGICVDPEVLDELSEEFQVKLSVLEQEIYQLAGEQFNINSPKQLGHILFDKLRLPYGRKTKTGYSTDMKVLEKLAPKHDLPARIMRYRNLAKLLSTYVEKLSTLMDPETGRVHTSFNQTVTATGRLSSSNPNLQNIPIRTEDGNRIRGAFVPGTGLEFLSADYSQIDLRVLAHYSQDEALLHAFNNGQDIHNRTAAEVFSVSEQLVTSDMRRAAKSINFGIVYGMSSFGLANQLEISRKQAQTFIDRYFDHYSGVKRYMKQIVEQATKDGYVTTLLNRRRDVPEIHSPNKTRRGFAERTAINSPIQGTAADIIKLAMIDVEQALLNEQLNIRMLLQIHDELVFELPEEEIDRAKQVIGHAMESAMQLDVPLEVNFSIGSSLAKD